MARRSCQIEKLLDELDGKLITLLRHDARRSISDLAGDLRVSRATVRARLTRLESSGAIVGYTVILDAEGVDQPVRGIMMIEIKGHVTDNVVRALGGLVAVTAIHTTNGRWDLIVELGTRTLTEFDAVLRRIRLVPGVANSETHLLLTTPRSTRAKSPQVRP